MYLPSAQAVLTAGMALTGTIQTASKVVSGSVMDYAVEKCIDSDGNVRCTKPFPVVDGTCYTIEWSTEGMRSLESKSFSYRTNELKGTFTHTTVEVRDAGSDEIVFYRDTNGDWTPDKKELVYMDFKPKVPNTGNSTVSYKVKTCD